MINLFKLNILFVIIIFFTSICVFRIADFFVINYCNHYYNIINNVQDNFFAVFDRNGIELIQSMSTISCYTIINSRIIWVKKYMNVPDQKKIYTMFFSNIFFVKQRKKINIYCNLFAHLYTFINIITRDKDIKHIILSLDYIIQYQVRREFKAICQKYNSKGGIVVIINNKNNTIISCISLPDFNPNNFIFLKSVLNKNFYGIYELGSIFKILNLAVSLDINRFCKNEKYDISKVFKMGIFELRDYKKDIKSLLSISEIIIYSSNIGSSKILKKITIYNQKKYFRRLDILDNININFLYNIKTLFTNDVLWQDYSAITMSYGHGIALNIITTINCFLSVLNGGVISNINFIDKKKNNNFKKILKYGTSLQINRILKLTTDKGYSRKAFSIRYHIGSKTGTAEKIKNRQYARDKNIAACIVSYPASKPVYTFLIFVDIAKEYSTGGNIVAPIIPIIVRKLYYQKK